MDTALPQKFLFILDRNLAKAYCTEDRVCTSCDKVVLCTLLNCSEFIVAKAFSIIDFSYVFKYTS